MEDLAKIIHDKIVRDEDAVVDNLTVEVETKQSKPVVIRRAPHRRFSIEISSYKHKNLVTVKDYDTAVDFAADVVTLGDGDKVTVSINSSDESGRKHVIYKKSQKDVFTGDSCTKHTVRLLKKAGLFAFDGITDVRLLEKKQKKRPLSSRD